MDVYAIGIEHICGSLALLEMVNRRRVGVRWPRYWRLAGDGCQGRVILYERYGGCGHARGIRDRSNEGAGRRGDTRVLLIRGLLL
jgi:hypothetical protein